MDIGEILKADKPSKQARNLLIQAPLTSHELH